MAEINEYDVLILGGGPAGVSAAIWADEFGLSAFLVDRRTNLGGQLHNVFNAINNFAGAAYDNGADMAGFLAEQLAKGSTKALLGVEVVRADLESRRLSFSDHESVSGKALIIATGLRRRELNVPGETEFSAKGILRSGAKDPTEVAGGNVVIVGGGDSAFENALILAPHAKKILLVHRRKEFSARTKFAEKVRNESKIELLLESEVVGFSGGEKLEFVALRDKTGQISKQPVDHALIRIGYEPNSELFSGQLDLDEKNYISVDKAMRTSVERVYAIGDICDPVLQTIAQAAGAGSRVLGTVVQDLASLK